MRQVLPRLWGLFPAEKLKTAIVWAMGPRFIVSVLAVVVDSEGRVLLFRHTHDRAHPWGLPSGRLEVGETLSQALLREFAEESGLEVRVGPLVTVEREFPLPVVRVAFACQVLGGSFHPSAEVTAARYFAKDELPSTIRPLQRSIILCAQRAREVRRASCESL